MHSELNDEQYRLLQTFNDLAAGSPTTDVAASDAAQAAEFDPRSLDFDAALSYLVDVGLLMGTGGDRYRITVAGINEVQRRPPNPLSPRDTLRHSASIPADYRTRPTETLAPGRVGGAGRVEQARPPRAGNAV